MCTVDGPSLSDSITIKVRLVLMFVGVSLSLLGLSLTAIISILLSEHRTVPGFNLLSLVGSLFVAYVSATVGVIHKGGPPSICLVAGIIHIFTILASVFWMNVVAFDIWQSLSTVRHLDQYRISEHCGRLVRYSAYAWGMPALLVGSGGALDRIPGVPEHLRPNFVSGCWFSQETTLATKLMYHAPIGVVMMSNMIFFLLTARLVYHAQRQRHITMRVADAQRYHFSLYVKLFLVMGLTWVMESLVGQIRSVYYELVSDFVNTLQGFFIFFIFGCKMRVVRRLQRCCCRKSNRHAFGATLASSYPPSSYSSYREGSIKITNNTGLHVGGNLAIPLQNDTSC